MAGAKANYWAFMLLSRVGGQRARAEMLHEKEFVKMM